MPRSALRWVVVVCLFALTFARGFDWRDEETLLDSTLRAAETPVALSADASRLLERSERENDREAAERAIARTEDFFRLYREDIHLSPEPPEGLPAVPQILGSYVLVTRARAQIVLGRHGSALRTAREATDLFESPECRFVASLALQNLDRFAEAADEMDAAIRAGMRSDEAVLRLAELLFFAGRAREGAGDRAAALWFYRASWETFPDPERNAPPLQAIRRLEPR
jgi:tetratricopeptide (TPR) repeat protein